MPLPSSSSPLPPSVSREARCSIDELKNLEQQYWHYVDHGGHGRFEDYLCRKLGLSLSQCHTLARGYNKYKRNLATDGIIMYCRTESKLLLVCNRGANIWSMPKGKREAGENSLTCALREFREETGLDVSQELNEHSTKVTIHRTTFYVLYVDTLAKVEQFHSAEIAAVRWVTLSEILTHSAQYSKQCRQVAEYLCRTTS